MKLGIVILFGLASFLAPAMLFSVEPMIGKMLLPVCGGAPAVWNTCLVYFQIMLLCGYMLAHRIASWQSYGPRARSLFAVIILAALMVAGYLAQPIAFERNLGRQLATAQSPAVALLVALALTTAVPLVLVSAATPVLQRWFASAGDRRSHDPYFLYAASNAGSLVGLVSYPWLVEPNLGLAEQSRAWRVGFLILSLLLIVCGAHVERVQRKCRSAGRGEVEHPPGEQVPGFSRRFRWLTLVFVPSSWLLGVTSYLTTDLAAIPLLWTVPLALYLVSFVVAFSPAAAGVVRALSSALPYLIAPLVLVMSAGFTHIAWIPLHLLAFFAGSVACHGALVSLRPASVQATSFYVVIALGGLLGGISSALIAPVVFDRVVEYPVAIVLACVVPAPIHWWSKAAWGRKSLGDLAAALVVFALIAALVTNRGGLSETVIGVAAVMIASGLGLYSCVTARARPVRFALVAAATLIASALGPGVSGQLLHIERNFFGVTRVTFDAGLNVHRLFHGSTLHGQQSLDPDLRGQPLSYFSRSGPIGDVFRALEPRLVRAGVQVAIIGLGAGTLASYAQRGQRWTFYEIDAAIERIARDQRYFTYLADSMADAIEIAHGDARLRLSDAPDHSFHLIVLDAFSSDVVPIHLISREAISLYKRKLTPAGVLALHLSNRYLDLGSIMARQAQDANLVYRVRRDLDVSDIEKRAGKQASIWAVMTAIEADLGLLAADPRWRADQPIPGSTVWTDDFSDLASYLRLWPRWPSRRN